MRKFCTVLVLSLVALLHVAPGCLTRRGAESTDDDDALARQPIAVRLIIPDEVFDPDNPTENVVRCLVRNNTKKRITVIDQVLFARDRYRGVTSLALPHLASGSLSVEPNEEQVFLECPLDNMLLHPERIDAHCRWTYKDGAPGQDQGVCPIGEPGDWYSATFWAIVAIDGKDAENVESNRVLLRVQGDERGKASDASPR